MQTRFSIKLISPPPFISAVSDELRQFSLYYFDCLQYSALNEITYTPKKVNQTNNPFLRDISLKNYCDSLDKNTKNHSSTKYYESPLIDQNSFDSRLTAYSPSAHQFVSENHQGTALKMLVKSLRNYYERLSKNKTFLSPSNNKNVEGFLTDSSFLNESFSLNSSLKKFNSKDNQKRLFSTSTSGDIESDINFMIKEVFDYTKTARASDHFVSFLYNKNS